ncbi:hypothetical protein IWQ60_012065 [Tieghemiomyces parasiticus]|uniref:DUF455 domain-containing protein n=1 Tax=Tieghemiomyces parasiticus TaxID=78921 RepID=A0A9W7ZQT5_9FUNG|nr:hypothetical protein IWQ60_012065 [Tieghemiomyces parasiticus]
MATCDATATPTLCDWCLRVLNTPDPTEKVTVTQELSRQWTEGLIKEIGHGQALDRPARPDDLEFVAPGKAVKLGKAGSLRSRIAILHSLANVEQWAIDTAVDTIVRFGSVGAPVEPPCSALLEHTTAPAAAQPLPRTFYDDFVRMAAEEAKHFLWLTQRLGDLGSHFGALPVHAGIWDSAFETRHALVCRVGIVQMVQESRGLDVSDSTVEKFRAVGDTPTADMLTAILADEVTHVATGYRWFSHECDRRGLDRQACFRSVVRHHFRGVLKPPFNEAARRAAGMEPELYQGLDAK